MRCFSFSVDANNWTALMLRLSSPPCATDFSLLPEESRSEMLGKRLLEFSTLNLLIPTFLENRVDRFMRSR